MTIRILKVQKNTGCIIEAVVFSNGKVAAAWQTNIPEVAIYDNIEQFFKTRTSERGYTVIYDSATPQQKKSWIAKDLMDVEK